MALTAFLTSVAWASDGTWHGKSNNRGGEVENSYNIQPNDPRFDPEMTEGGSFSIRCDGFDHRLTVSFMGDHQVKGDATRTAVFVVDADSYERRGDLGNGGLFPETPVIVTNNRDPLIGALINGSQLRVFVGSRQGEPVFESDLAGTGKLMRQHLGACL